VRAYPTSITILSSTLILDAVKHECHSRQLNACDTTIPGAARVEPCGIAGLGRWLRGMQRDEVSRDGDAVTTKVLISLMTSFWPRSAARKRS
jgi:hypothetical protein